jgi:hypothetical protein
VSRPGPRPPRTHTASFHRRKRPRLRPRTNRVPCS